MKQQLAAADAAEVVQQAAKAAAKDATGAAKETLKQAYITGSTAVDLMTGLRGKNHSLINEIRKMRK